MSRRSEVTPPATTALPLAAQCAYCGGPIRAPRSEEPEPPLPKYCCYGCRLLGEAGQRPLSPRQEKGTPWFKIAVGGVLAGQAMLLGLAVNLAPPSDSSRWLLHGALLISSGAALVLLGRPLFVSAFEEVRHRRVTIELLFLAGILGALGASLHSSLTGVGAVYYEVVAVLLTVYSIGKTLGAESRARAIQETRRLAQTFETCRRVAPGGSEAMVRVAEVRVGDRVRVLPGDPIPIDGRITRGQAFVCETPLTGEPFPVVRRPGDTVFAGSYSEDGELWLTATVPGTERRLDALLSALELAREQPSRLQIQADRIVRWFLPLVIALSLGTFLFWGLRSSWSEGLFNALAVLLVACPCAMGLATPVALWNALATLAARGLVLRGGHVIERLAALDRLVFDKTGTLSDESYSLIDLATVGTAGERRLLLAQLCAVQNVSSHPVARAFQSLSAVQTCERSGAPSASGRGLDAFQALSLKTVPGLGVEAWVRSASGEEHHLRVGQRELMSDLASEAYLLSLLRQSPGDQLVFVEVDGRLQAVAAVRERLRDSTADTLRWLSQLGVGCAVMTGDQASRAAALLPAENVQGGLTPQMKADRIAALVADGGVIGFVGDGVNDAPALRQASVGLALAHGAGVTTTNADAVLYGGDLRVLPWAVALSRRVRQSIHSNLVFAAAYNGLGMVLAATGLLHPVAAALLMVVSSFTVSWRALRSTDDAGPCCAPLPATSRAARLPDSDVARPALRLQRLWGVLVMAQAPFLIYLGQLETGAALALSAVLMGLGLLIIRFQTANPEWRGAALMTFAMLGPGNWGMILGWWADSRFGPAAGGCPHCAAYGFNLFAFAHMPGMNLGMLALGLPPMLLDSASARPGLSRVAFAVLSALGMVWGMSFGDYAAMRWLGQAVSQRFLLSFAGMTVGMLIGMFLFCEFGRAISLALGPRRSRPRSGTQA